MSQSSIFTTEGLRFALQQTAKDIHRSSVRERAFKLGSWFLVLIAAYFVLDLLFGLSAELRWVIFGGIVGFAAWSTYDLLRRHFRVRIEEQEAARAIEVTHPELDNALIHAVQFEDRVAGAKDVQASLMGREIERAQAAATRLSVTDVIDRRQERRALQFLAAGLAAWAAVAVAFSGAFFTVMPRLFAPWLDDVTPAFSLTKIAVNPGGATVTYGGALALTVSVTGPVPENLVMSTRSGNGPWRDSALESTEPGKYTFVLDSLRDDTWYCVTGGGTRSGRYLAKILLPPKAGKVTATYTFPKYTDRKPTTEPLNDQGLHGLRGTHALVKVESNRGLKGGELFTELEDGTTAHYALRVDPQNPAAASADVPITGNGKFRIALTASDDQTNLNAREGKIVLEHDQHPTVWFNEPAQEILVTPTMKVAIGVEAEDDTGIQRVSLHRVINNIADSPADVYSGSAIKRLGQRAVMDLADLGVRPGDEITYYADAYDNDPSQPNYAETEPYKMKVVSEEEYIKSLKGQSDSARLSREMKDVMDAVSSLADQQEELAKKLEKIQQELAKNPSDPGLQKQLKDAQKEQSKLQEKAKSLAEELKEYSKTPAGSDLEKALKKKVGEMAEQVQQAANGPMKQAQSSNAPQAAQSARQAAEALKKSKETGEKQVSKSIDNFDKVAPLFADAERFKELLNRQGQLVLAAKQYQDQDANDPESKSKLDHIAAEQESIKNDLQQLQADFRQHAAEAKEDFPKAAASALKIADEIDRRAILPTMTSADSSFSKHQGQNGYRDAQEAFNQMKAMMGQCNGGQGQCEGELDVKLSESLSQSGLGKSLSQCMGSGQGRGQGRGAGSGAGQGIGNGSGGMQSGGSGTSPGGSTTSSAQAYVMSTKSIRGQAGSKKANANGRAPGQPANIAPDNVEVLGSAATVRPKAGDSATKGYPVEYRKLVKDYFVAVAKDKK